MTGLVKLMNNLYLRTEGHPILSQVCEPVPHREDISELLSAMWDVMYKNKGIGLAAPQIGENARVMVMDIKSLKIGLINPVITERKLGMVRSTEGCLSFPGKKVTVMRSKMIKVEGFSPFWTPIKLKLRGLAAMCVQHEIDHLNGINIVENES